MGLRKAVHREFDLLKLVLLLTFIGVHLPLLITWVFEALVKGNFEPRYFLSLFGATLFSAAVTLPAMWLVFAKR